MAQTALIDLFEALEVAFEEMRAFGGLDDRRFPARMRDFKIVKRERAMDVGFFKLAIDGVEPVQKVVAGVARLFVRRKVDGDGSADGGKAGVL